MVATAAPPRLASSDALGRRVEKIVTGATYRYIYSGVETVSVYTSTGTWKQDYVYGSGIDELLMLEQADVLDWDGASNTSEVARSWYRANALGSILRVEEPDRTEAVSYRYDPYGEVTITRGGVNQSGDPLGQFVTYTGRWRDEETGLYHCRARVQEPIVAAAVAAWLSMALTAGGWEFERLNPTSWTASHGTSFGVRWIIITISLHLAARYRVRSS